MLIIDCKAKSIKGSFKQRDDAGRFETVHVAESFIGDSEQSVNRFITSMHYYANEAGEAQVRYINDL